MIFASNWVPANLAPENLSAANWAPSNCALANWAPGNLGPRSHKYTNTNTQSIIGEYFEVEFILLLLDMLCQQFVDIYICQLENVDVA